MATGRKPNRVAGRIYRSLDDQATLGGKGEAFTDNMGFAVPELPSGRESFSPDASYYDGPLPANPMRFIEGPPNFAAEFRSENDYSPLAELDMADKRADYFAAGTLVVWDVDPLAECIHVYKPTDPTRPTTYHRGPNRGRRTRRPRLADSCRCHFRLAGTKCQECPPMAKRQERTDLLPSIC